MAGGTMSGNWAMGSRDMATSPRITMRIEITMATMGRLIKNFDMAAYPFLSAAGAAGLVSGAAAAGALGLNGLGLTTAPGRAFWVPSTTIVSPGFSPSVMIQSE